MLSHFLVVIGCSVAFLTVSLLVYLKECKKREILRNLYQYNEIFGHIKDLAYIDVYNRFRIVEASSGIKLDGEELKNLSEKYVSSVIFLMGKKMRMDFFKVYDRESFIEILALEFVNRISMDSYEGLAKSMGEETEK